MHRRRGAAWGIFPLAGWLFTDLLLELTVIFLVASVSGTPPPPQQPPCLERRSQFLQITVDAQGLVDNNAQAIANVQAQLKAFQPIQGRRVGLVITYGGTPNDDGSSFATQIGAKVNQVLADLGKQGFVFTDAVYHDPLRVVGLDFSQVQLELYLFALPGNCN